MIGYRYPRISLGGTLILTIYMVGLWILYDGSLYKKLLVESVEVVSYSSSSTSTSGSTSTSTSTGGSTSTLLNSFVLATSFVNALTHSAVVLGFLNDTYVISILLGVGFDVVTRILQLIWWVHITINMNIIMNMNINTNTIEHKHEHEHEHEHEGEDKSLNLYHTTAVYVFLLAALYIYHMTVHVQALLAFPSSSASKLISVLTSATNNLRGIPGRRYSDHMFAYSDLGWHLLLSVLSYVLLQRQDDGDGGGLLVPFFQIFGAFIVLSYVIALSLLIPQNNNNNNNNNTTVQMEEQYINGETIVEVGDDGKIYCRCTACRRKSNRCSFTLNIKDGVCLLWLYSFEQLLNILRSKLPVVVQVSKLD